LVVNAKSILVVIAVICFAIGVAVSLSILSLGKVDWTDLGLFFGFLSFLV
jgi:hypothetical protein